MLHRNSLVSQLEQEMFSSSELLSMDPNSLNHLAEEFLMDSDVTGVQNSLPTGTPSVFTQLLALIAMAQKF